MATKSFLCCTEALEDLILDGGCHTKLRAEANGDLASMLQERYFDDVKVGSTIHESSSRLGAPSPTNFMDPLNVTLNEGHQLRGFLSSIMHDAIFQFRTPATLAFIFISFPRSCPIIYIYGYQLVILEKLEEMTMQVVRSADVDAFQVITSAINLTVPLVRSRLLDPHIMFRILQLLLQVIREITNDEQIRHKLLVNLKDIGMSAR